MSKEVVHRGLEFLCENAKNQALPEERMFHAMIFGGEPTLELDLIEEICSFGFHLSRQKNVPFSATIITNGTIMNDRLKYIIMEYKDKINLTCQISIDGIKKAHDSSRVFYNGQGSFDIIEENVEIYKEIYKNTPEKLHLHGCITKKNLPYLFESFKYFREQWNIPRLWFMPVHEEQWDENDVELYRKENEKISEYLLSESIENNSIDTIRHYSPINRCLMNISKPSSPCGAGKGFITITTNGDIYPCHHFYYNDPEKETYMGNIWDGIKDDLRKDCISYCTDDMDCGDCDHHSCYRCIAVNWIVNGSILKQVKGNYCKMSYINKEINDKTRELLVAEGLIEKDFNLNYRTNQNKNDKYFEENAINIISKALQLVISQLDEIKKENIEIKDVLINLQEVTKNDNKCEFERN